MTLPPLSEYWSHDWITLKCKCWVHYYGCIKLMVDSTHCLRMHRGDIPIQRNDGNVLIG